MNTKEKQMCGLGDAIEHKYRLVHQMFGSDTPLPLEDSDPRAIKVNLSAVDAHTNGESVDEVIEVLRRFAVTPFTEVGEEFTIRFMFTDEKGVTTEINPVVITRELLTGFIAKSTH